MGAAKHLFRFVSMVSLISYFFRRKNIQPKEKERENESSTPPNRLKPKEKEKKVCNRERKRANESSSTPSNSHLPWELIEKILLRISVKNLLRYKCVSKSWHTLIEDIYFVKKHLEYNVESNTNLGLIVQENGDDNWMRTIRLHDMVGHDQYNFVRVEASTVCNIVGSCNGLLCLSNQSKNIAICNPSTGKAYNLPYYPTEISHTESFSPIPEIQALLIFGFGYDSVNGDYKLMAMKVKTIGNNIYFCIGLWSYSLKTKAWTVSSSPSFRSKQYKIFPRYGIFANNALHWIMNREDFNPNHYERYLIGAFDLRGDQFYEVELPDYFNFNNVANVTPINLGVLNRCLCVCSYHPTVTTPVDVWVMKEYNVKKSWTKFISFLPTGPDLNSSRKPLAYSTCGDKVLLLDCYDTYSNLIWYDLKTKNITKIMLLGKDWCDICLAEVYMYSLVDPNNYN